MTNDTYFSRCCLTERIPVTGRRCVFCGTPLRKDSPVYKFARIDPKDVVIQYAYTHISCGDKWMGNKKDENPIPDEKLKALWDGIEELQGRRTA